MPPYHPAQFVIAACLTGAFTGRSAAGADCMDTPTASAAMAAIHNLCTSKAPQNCRSKISGTAALTHKIFIKSSRCALERKSPASFDAGPVFFTVVASITARSRSSTGRGRPATSPDSRPDRPARSSARTRSAGWCLHARTSWSRSRRPRSIAPRSSCP